MTWVELSNKDAAYHSGQYVLVTNGSQADVARYDRHGIPKWYTKYGGSDCISLKYVPTHWMTLPALPKVKK